MAGQIKSGVSAGQHKESNVQQGTHEYKIYDFTHAKWGVAKSDIGTDVQLEIGIVGAPSGTVLSITILKRDVGKTDSVFDIISTQASGDTVTRQWTFPRSKWSSNAPSTYPQFYFKCSNHLTGKCIQSGMLEFYKNVTISVVDMNNRPAANEPYKIVMGTSQILSGQTDSNGKINLQRLTLGQHFIKFVNNPLITPKKMMKIDSPFVVSKYPIDFFANQTFYKNEYVAYCSH
jgi:hypothetical protein